MLVEKKALRQMVRDGNDKEQLYFVFDIDDNSGLSPLFLEIRGSETWGEEIKIIEPRDGLMAKTLICFRTSLAMGQETAAIKGGLLRLEIAQECLEIEHTTPAWSFITKDSKYVFGRNVANFLQAVQDFEEVCYQFSLVFILAGATILNITGRIIDKGFCIDSAEGISPYPDKEVYEQYALALKGRPRVSTTYAEVMQPDYLNDCLPVQYLGGIWIHHTDPGQPDIGVFAITDSLFDTIMDQIFGARFPKVRYDENLVIPINYGTSSAVHYIRKKGKMVISRANHMLDNIYSISARDPFKDREQP